MNKQDLINNVADNTDYAKKDVENVVIDVFNQIAEALKNGEDVNIAGFGKFESRETKARNGMNPKLFKELKEQGVDEVTAKQQAAVAIAASRKPTFKPAKALKDSVKL
ncbi:HU family DNA-binding protein [Paenibacillus sp. HJL G12]|uniref:HU family DNA-binding protein n=1 Tax=Paenibacillus dendrobii TaxID=2691084 RepID=A0A7X3IKC0_9BACL|nr:HU family DNA-binding protein [Paenibacillus dendrobii]MWV44956.1 HU family DNA-binding protein [Paenibacillus dendrobii]